MISLIQPLNFSWMKESQMNSRPRFALSVVPWPRKGSAEYLWRRRWTRATKRCGHNYAQLYIWTDIL